MNQQNNGLTVGELTVSLGVLFIIFISWSAIGNKENESQGYLLQGPEETIVNKSNPKYI